MSFMASSGFLFSSDKGDKGMVGDKGEGVFTGSWMPSQPCLGFPSHTHFDFANTVLLEACCFLEADLPV